MSLYVWIHASKLIVLARDAKFWLDFVQEVLLMTLKSYQMRQLPISLSGN